MEGVTEWVEREVSTPSLPPAPGGDGGDGGDLGDDLGVGTSHPYGEGNPERACHVCVCARTCVCVWCVAVCSD